MASRDHKPVRLFLWVVPRTISSALTKCLSFIEGMEIWFELFTACAVARDLYQRAYNGEDDLPMEYKGNEEKIEKGITIFEELNRYRIGVDYVVYDEVRQRMEASTSKYIIAKEGYFAFTDEKSFQYLPKGFRHVFLIRDPVKALGSYRRTIYTHLTNKGLRTGEADDEQAFDVGKDDPFLKAGEFYSGTHAIWQYIRANVDQNPIVLNTDDLLANPAAVLSKFCKETGLPYSDSLLNWDASLDVTDKWHIDRDRIMKAVSVFFDTALESSRFYPSKPAPPLESLTPDLKRIVQESMPYYTEMNKYKI